MNGGFYPRSGIDTTFTASPFTYQTIQRKANCVFHDRANANLLSGNKTMQTVSIADATDGASNTAAFSENLLASYWTLTVSPFTVDASWQNGQPVNANNAGENQGSNLMVWLYVTEPNRPGVPNVNPVIKTAIPVGNVEQHMKVNGKLSPLAAAPHPAEIWRPSSQHSGGVNMAFLDGSTRFVSQGIQYHVYQSLLSPQNQKSDMPENRYVLASSDTE